jgi:hypothetical protein
MIPYYLLPYMPTSCVECEDFHPRFIYRYYTFDLNLLLGHWKSRINLELEEPIGYPAQPGLIHPSVCLSIHACRLGIWQKMAQAQQIRSIIL